MTICLLLLAFLIAIGNSAYFYCSIFTGLRPPFICNYYHNRNFVLCIYTGLFLNLLFQSLILKAFLLTFCLGHFLWKFCFAYWGPTYIILHRKNKLLQYTFYNFFCVSGLVFLTNPYILPLLSILLLPKIFSLFFYSI